MLGCVNDITLLGCGYNVYGRSHRSGASQRGHKPILDSGCSIVSQDDRQCIDSDMVVDCGSQTLFSLSLQETG